MNKKSEKSEYLQIADGYSHDLPCSRTNPLYAKFLEVPIV